MASFTIRALNARIRVGTTTTADTAGVKQAYITLGVSKPGDPYCEALLDADGARAVLECLRHFGDAIFSDETSDESDGGPLMREIDRQTVADEETRNPETD